MVAETGRCCVRWLAYWLVLQSLQFSGVRCYGNSIATATFSNSAAVWQANQSYWRVRTNCNTLTYSGVLNANAGHILTLFDVETTSFVNWVGNVVEEDSSGRWNVIQVTSDFHGGAIYDYAIQYDASKQYSVTAVDGGTCYLYRTRNDLDAALAEYQQQQGANTPTPPPSSSSPASSQTAVTATDTSAPPTTGVQVSTAADPVSTAAAPVSISVVPRSTSAVPVSTAAAASVPIPLTIMNSTSINLVPDRPPNKDTLREVGEMKGTMPLAPALWYTAGINVVQCSRRCVRDGKCQSVFYSADTGHCLGYHQQFSAGSYAVPNSVYYVLG